MAELRLIALGVVAALAGTAVASTDLIVTAPAKWRFDRERSAAMTLAALGAKPVGNAPSVDVTEAYFPNEIGAALIVTRSSTTGLPDGRAAAIAAVVDELEGWGARSAASGAPITDASADRKALDDGKVLELTVGGRDASASTRSMFRMIIVADASHLVTVTGLCLDRDDSNPEHVAACRAALTTLDPGIAIADRVALGFPAPAAPVEPPPAPTAVKSTAPSMGDGSRLKFAPITVPSDPPSTDRRPIYLGLGLVVLAAIFWWNRRKRSPDATGDDDEDLHAAAASPTNHDEKKQP